MNQSVRFDFHCHSNASDGMLSPDALMQRAARNEARWVALTDHDRVEGLSLARQTAQSLGMQFVNGVEISVSWRDLCVHIVGLHFDADHQPMIAGLKQMTSGRAQRAQRMSDELAAVGIANAYERALVYANGRVDLLSRTHFARVIVDDKKSLNVRHVFQDYLTEGKPGFVAHQWAELAQAIQWIQDAGGIAVLAHPGRYRHDEPSGCELVAEFMALGGRAIEVMTGSHSKKQMRYYAQMAQDLGLYASAGSDFHAVGESKMDIGRVPVLPLGLPAVHQLWQ